MSDSTPGAHAEIVILLSECALVTVPFIPLLILCIISIWV